MEMEMNTQIGIFETIGSVRGPIQCAGITRGPERMAEIAASGAVNPQKINWGGIIKTAAPILLSLL
jgi:hypothetical protein